MSNYFSVGKLFFNEYFKFIASDLLKSYLLSKLGSKIEILNAFTLDN